MWNGQGSDLKSTCSFWRTIPNNRETAKLQNCPGSLQRPRTRIMALTRAKAAACMQIQTWPPGGSRDPSSAIKSVQFNSVAQLCLTLCHPMDCSTPGLPVHHQLPPTHVHLSRWGHPTISSSVVPFSSCPQSFPASGSFQMSQLFAWGGQSIGSFSFSISPSNEYSGLISFRMDGLDLLAVQGTLKSLVQHHSSKASILRRSAFFIVQLSHPLSTRKVLHPRCGARLGGSGGVSGQHKNRDKPWVHSLSVCSFTGYRVSLNLFPHAHGSQPMANCSG